MLKCYPNIVKMSIGSKVRKFRNLKSLSQSDLALRSDVSQSIISSLESDKSIPNSVMLRRIAEVLDVDINELLKEDFINQNIFDKGIGNIQSQVTINNFPENILEDIISNQQKIFTMMESQNKLLESLLKK